MIEVGSLAPDFTLENQDGDLVKLSDLRGKKVVLYFYPRDNTPGCTTEALDFKANIDAFVVNNALVLGISKDSCKSHVNFRTKYELPFQLLSDSTTEVCQLFEVYQMKKLYGKESMGIVRSTFIIDEEGYIKDIYTKVKVDGHVEQVLEQIQTY